MLAHELRGCLHPQPAAVLVLAHGLPYLCLQPQADGVHTCNRQQYLCANQFSILWHSNANHLNPPQPDSKTSIPCWTAALLLAERPGRCVHPQPAAVPACQPVQHRHQPQAVGGGGPGDGAAHHPVDGAVDLPGGVPPGVCNPIRRPGPGVSGQRHRVNNLQTS